MAVTGYLKLADTAEERDLLRMAARIFGTMGGQATKGISTPAKRRASRANGKKGGRPRKPLSQLSAAGKYQRIRREKAKERRGVRWR